MTKKRKIIKPVTTEQEHILYGIVSSVNDYRLAWLLNKSLNIDLKKIEDLTVNIKKLDETVYYTRYAFNEESTNIQVLKNKDANSIKLFKLDFDFFIKVNTEFNNTTNIKKNLNKIDEIILVTKLDNNSNFNNKIITKINNAFLIDC